MKVLDDFLINLKIDLQKNIINKTINYAIFVLLIELLKIYHLILFSSYITEVELAKIIMQKVSQLHRVFSRIISNYGSLFIFLFWANLIYIFQIEQQLSMTFDFQIN